MLGFVIPVAEFIRLPGGYLYPCLPTPRRVRVTYSPRPRVRRQTSSGCYNKLDYIDIWRLVAITISETSWHCRFLNFDFTEIRIAFSRLKNAKNSRASRHVIVGIFQIGPLERGPCERVTGVEEKAFRCLTNVAVSFSRDRQARSSIIP